MQHKVFNIKEEELKLIRFYQNDLNSAKLLINVTHDKVVTDFSSATSVQIAFLKPDCKRVFQDVQNVNQMQGKYYVVLSTQTLIAYGNVIAQLRFTFPNNKVIETCKFAFTVDESIMSDDAMKSTNEFPVIQKAIEAGKKLEGIDIDGIIAAGAKADGALPKTGGTMTGNLVMDKLSRINFKGDVGTDILMFPKTGGGLDIWDRGNSKTFLSWNGSRLIFTNPTDITGETNLVKKSDIYPNFVQPSGRSISLTTGTDLNTIETSGYYVGNALLNAPYSSGVFYVQVQQHSVAGYVMQEATYLNATLNERFVRRKRDTNGWTPWVRMANYDDIVTKAKDGRVALTLTADATAGSSNPQLATRRGNTVTLSLDLMRNAGSTSAIVTTLPSDMTPVDSYTFDAIATDGTPSRVLIRFNGEIHLDIAGKRYRILATYVCN
ncbi:hypothetical protein COL05_13085 [Bacillus sp. AFS059628]|nr:hypothetical protein COL05_13085 [Bacillus sp. AFS059628]